MNKEQYTWLTELFNHLNQIDHDINRLNNNIFWYGVVFLILAIYEITRRTK